jgi:hypothetical protein
VVLIHGEEDRRLTMPPASLLGSESAAVRSIVGVVTSTRWAGNELSFQAEPTSSIVRVERRL